MLFRKRKKKRNEEPPEIMLRNQIFPKRESTLLLGMTLNSRLNCEKHITKRRAKIKKTINTIKVVTGRKRGEDWKIFKKLSIPKISAIKTAMRENFQ